MKNVLITIRGTQLNPGGESDSLELTTEGEYVWNNDSAAFSYMESALTGLEGTRTTFLVRQDSVTLSRAGTVTSRMVFEEGKNHRFLYETPYGSATLGLETESIRTDLGSSGGELEIRYTTDVEHNLISKNQFFITIREQKGTM
jgi:uncharacterized beta-barrel protein YwiB (DUF1934 family)